MWHKDMNTPPPTLLTAMLCTYVWSMYKINHTVRLYPTGFFFSIQKKEKEMQLLLYGSIDFQFYGRNMNR